MKKLYTIIILALVFINVNAQTPSWAWADGAEGGSVNVESFGTTTDNQGNVYVTGTYSADSITFGAFTLINAGGDSLSGSNGNDCYIVKYSSTGSVLWAKGAGGLYDDYGQGVTTDALGNVYVAGYFGSQSIVFGTDTLTNMSAFLGITDAFIVKYDALGNVLWTKRAGYIFGDRASDITTDASGNVYVTGLFDTQITFGSFTVSSGASYTQTFIVKYDSAGNALWAKSSTASSTSASSYGTGVSTDDSGNVYITGGTAYAPVTFGTTTLANAGGQDMFIVKYDASGTMQWARGAGGTGQEYGHDIAADAAGNVYIVGDFASPFMVFGTDTLTTNGGDDIFFVKYDASGNLQWVNGVNGALQDEAYSTTVDADGNAYILVSSWSSPLTFGTVTLTSSAVGSPIIVVKYNAAGNAIWAKKAECTAFGFHAGITTDYLGNVFVTGTVVGIASFDSDTLDYVSTVIYVAKLGNSSVSFEENFTSNEISFYPNPSNGIFKISKNVKTIEVFNLMGELILSQGNVNEINLNAFPSGMYIAKVNGEYACRLLKE